MDEALRSIKIRPKILLRMSNALWDISLATEEANLLTGSILEKICLLTEYMGTRMTKETTHCVLVEINGDRLGTFFYPLGQVKYVSAAISKLIICTADFVLQVILTRKSFGEIPNVLRCRKKMLPFVVETRRPYRWSSGVLGHMSKRVRAARTQLHRLTKQQQRKQQQQQQRKQQ